MEEAWVCPQPPFSALPVLLPALPRKNSVCSHPITAPSPCFHHGVPTLCHHVMGCWLTFHPASPTGLYTPQRQEQWLTYPGLWSQCLEQWLAQSRCSINICWLNDYVGACMCVSVCMTWLTNNQTPSIGEEFLMECYWKWKAQILRSWPSISCYWPQSILAGGRSTLGREGCLF